VTTEELDAIDREVDEILAEHGLEWIREEVEELMLDRWADSSSSPADDEPRRRAARLVLTLGGVHRAVRLLLATELGLERAQVRHTDGRPWLVIDRGGERPLVEASRELVGGTRLDSIRDVAEAADALAADVAAEFQLPHRSRSLASQAELEDLVARDRSDETAAWAAFAEPGALDPDSELGADAL
jgi:hypothetical protein